MKMRRISVLIVMALLGSNLTVIAQDEAEPNNAKDKLNWKQLPDLPNELGVAGPYVGVTGPDEDVLIIAGGANFPQPVWEAEKVWHDDIHVLVKSGDDFSWQSGGTLSLPLAYGAAVSTPEGVICMGGNDSQQTYNDVFRLSWNPLQQEIETETLPALPQPVAHGTAILLDGTVYFACGQTGTTLDTATGNLWALDLTNQESIDNGWQVLPSLPGKTRSLQLMALQHNGFDDCLYVMSGRREEEGEVEFLRDVWEYNPTEQTWRQRADAPRSTMAGTAMGWGQSHIFVLGGADGSMFTQADILKDDHPGFPREALAYHTITDTWVSAGTMPANHVTTIAVEWQGAIVIPSGEVRPRVRSPRIWSVTPQAKRPDFGTLNYVVLVGYLGMMVLVGVWFMLRTNSTDDFFRGGKQIPWWAAGCSIFATMLSSLTYTGLPSKAYAQDWVYLAGNMTIPFVAWITIRFALPFFRQIDATSAYEYLELRFSRGLRQLGSTCFMVFHVFRMAIVMSLTGLALAVATPLSPSEAVMLMGVLSIAYCAMGGIEAVIWTDTIQTVVLLGGAVLALGLLVSGVDGGFDGFISTSADAGKFKLANSDLSIFSSHTAFWVIIVGGLAQNTASYTSDQAVVQRYMTTPDTERAARAIWTNGLLSIPATVLVFAIGTGLYAFYQAHPDKLDPTITTDQIFPLFIAREMPAGIAGLIVAGVFAAAQSTVSTSMNSTATAFVIDFLQPLNALKTDRGYLWAARILTVTFGIAGTLLGLVFVDPDIKSLFDSFIRVIGVFMGILGGLFILGALTTRTTATGALVGAAVGTATMLSLWQYSSVSSYLYTACGISICCLTGYLTSYLQPAHDKDLTGLTLHTMLQERSPESPAS